jgi:DNA-binding transcriptional LysR family regulator
MVNFTSRQLRAFLLVAHHRSFARAAEALYLTPSGLSVLIRELETQLGFRLFDRTTRHVAPTASGAELLPVAQRSLEELDAATARLARPARSPGEGGAASTLALGAPPLIAANILPPVIREVRAHRPDLRIRLVDASHNEILRLVETGELDMGLGAFFGAARTTRRRPLFRFSLMVIRAAGGPGGGAGADETRRATTWTALRAETLVSLPPTSPLQILIDAHLQRAGVEARGPRMNSLDMQIAMVEAGEGVAVIPSYGVPACRNRRVAMSRLVRPVVALDFSEVCARGKRLPAGAGDFTTFLQHHMARWAGRAGVL